MSAQPQSTASQRRRGEGFFLSHFAAAAAPAAPPEGRADFADSYLEEIGFDFEPDDAAEEAVASQAPASTGLPEDKDSALSSAPLAIAAATSAGATSSDFTSPSPAAEMPTAVLAGIAPPLPAAEPMAAPGDVTVATAENVLAAGADGSSEEGFLLPAAAEAEDDLPPSGPSLPPEADFAAGDVLPDYLDLQEDEGAEKAGRVLTEDDEIEDLLAALGDAERREKRENQNKTLAKSARPEQPAPGSAAISSLPQPPAAAEARRAISQAHPAGMSAPAGIPAPAAGASAASASLPPDATWNRGGLPPAPPSTPSDEPEEMLGDEAIADLISASALPAAPPSSSPPPAVEGAASGQPPQLSAAGDKAAPPPLPPEVAWDSGSRPLPASPSPPGADNKQTLGDEANADLIGAASAVTPSASSASEVELAAAGPQPPLAEGATPAASPPLAAEDELADLLTAAAAPPSLAAAKTLTMPRLEETRSAQNQEVASAAEQQAATAGEDQKAEAKHRDTMALLEQGLLATSSPGEKSGAEPGKSGAAASKAEAPAAAAATPAAASAAEDLIALLENRAASPSAVGTSVFSAPGAPAAQKDPADTAAGKLQRLLDAIAWRENWALYCDLLAALIFTLSLAVIISHFLWHPPPVP